MTSQLLLVKETGMPGVNHRLTPGRWQPSHIPQAGLEPATLRAKVCLDRGETMTSSSDQHFTASPLGAGAGQDVRLRFEDLRRFQQLWSYHDEIETRDRELFPSLFQ